jgi:hypothetical protein
MPITIGGVLLKMPQMHATIQGVFQKCLSCLICVSVRASPAIALKQGPYFSFEGYPYF